MKNIFFLLIAIIYHVSYAQEGIVYYEFTNAIGVGGGNGEVYNAYAMFSKDKSYYVVAKDSLENAVSLSKAKSHYQNSNGNYNKISNGLILSPQGEQVVCDYGKKILYSNILDGKQIYVSEMLPKFSWKITKQKKKIGSFDCVLANTTFRGRKYYAWYAPEIAVYSGPWKLNGLPGMILEAYDEGKNVMWNFKSYKFPITVKQDYTIRKGKNSKKVKFLSLDEFKIYYSTKIEKDYDRAILIAKNYPGMTPIKEPMASYYLESFE